MSVDLIGGVRPVLMLSGCGEDIHSAYADDFDVLVLEGGKSGAQLKTADGNALTYPPQGGVALVVGSESDREATAAWAQSAGVDSPVLVHSEALPPLLRHTAGRLLGASSYAAQVALELADLRVVHEGLQNSYSAMRELVDAAGLAVPHLEFSTQPDKASTPDKALEIVQPLPIELRRLFGISIHIARTPPAFALGELRVELRARDDSNIVVRWNLPYETLAIGWTTLVLEQTGSFDTNSAELRIIYDLSGDPGPLVSLGSRVLRQNNAATIDGVVQDRPIAMKLWTSIPNVPLSGNSAMERPIAPAGDSLSKIELTYHQSSVVEDSRKLKERAGFTPIEVLGVRSLRVHPLDDDPAVARLPRACPKGTLTVVAEVETLHENAGTVEYAISLNAPVERTKGDVTSLDFGPQTVWTTVSAQSPGHLTLQLEKPLEQGSDLYLITRMSEGESDGYAWATFKRVYFRGFF